MEKLYGITVSNREKNVVFDALGVSEDVLKSVILTYSNYPLIYVRIYEDNATEPEEDEVIKAMEIIKQFCKDCTECHGCRFRNREWGKRCLLNEDIPAYWKYYKEEGESNE